MRNYLYKTRITTTSKRNDGQTLGKGSWLARAPDASPTYRCPYFRLFFFLFPPLTLSDWSPCLSK